MSFYTQQTNEEELLNSQSSDEKMDTASESFPTQGTPNSVLSSDFDDRDSSGESNRLHNPEDIRVLRLAEPQHNQNKKSSISNLKKDLNDSFITKMSNLNLNSPPEEITRPKNLRISPPRLSSTLTTATSHPLMGLGSPDENYPDLIPKKLHKLEDEKDLSLSSIEDERPNETNGFYSPQRNTSKNNLYITENFVTADSHLLGESRLELSLTPDVAQVEQKIERRKIVPRFLESPKVELTKTPQRVLGRVVDGSRDESAIMKYVEERNKKISVHSTPKPYLEAADVSIAEEFHTGVADWCESSSHMLSVPNFDVPIELSTNVNQPNELESPDVISSSTQSDGSLFKAHLSIHTGRVALKHNGAHTKEVLRRRIVVPPEEEDRCSLDSVSGDSLGPEEEPPAPLVLPPAEPAPLPPSCSDDDSTKRSKSSNTMSESSDRIPEYSAADELRDERYFISVQMGTKHATCDMKVIEPYKRVLSHGGYDSRGAAVIVFSACFLPDRTRADYTYVMDNLFLYVIWSLERLITDEYVLVYLHGSASRRRLPSVVLLHSCYKLIDRRLRKSLKHLYLVHPTFFLKSLVLLTKPFISSKFFRKISYVNTLEEMYTLVPVEPNAIPEIVKDFDATKR